MIERMFKRNIDRDARNPIYPGAMTLRDVTEGVAFVTYNVKDGGFMSFVTLTSSWTVSTETYYPQLEMDSRLIAQGHKSPRNYYAPNSKAETIFLDTRAIHPFESGEWNPGRFSVVATPENMQALDVWMKEVLGRGIMNVLWVNAAIAMNNRYVPKSHRLKLAEVIEPFLGELA